MNTPLANRRCAACESGGAPLAGGARETLLHQLDAWMIPVGGQLVKEFAFDDFKAALAFTNRIGELAETEGHHPDLELSWGRVRVILWTHSCGGLTENDFILAAKIDALPRC